MDYFKKGGNKVMIRKNAKIFALVLALAMVFSSVIAFAAEGDHYMGGILKYTVNQVRADVNARNHVRALPGEFQMEVRDNLYDLVDVNKAYAKDKVNWKDILTGEKPPEGDLEVVEISAITTNDIKGLVGRETGIEVTDVVILGTEAEITAVAKDKNGNPVKNAELLFVINGAETKGRNFDASAKFATGQNWATAKTNNKGEAKVKINATVEKQYRRLRINSNDDLLSFAYDEGAATEVSYIISYNGEAVTKAAVSFATIDSNLVTAGNFAALRRSAHPTVDVYPTPGTGDDDYRYHWTYWLYPFHGEDETWLAATARYASSREVTNPGDLNSLDVSAPYLGLNILSGQFNNDEESEWGTYTVPLTQQVKYLEPNFRDIKKIYSIPNNSNYATLNFTELSLSPGSAVTVYYVINNDYKVTGATTYSHCETFGDLNGAWIAPGVWAKTFYARPAMEWTGEKSMQGTQSLIDENFGVQIPANVGPGTVWVALETPGQIDPETNTGYSLKSLVVNYGGVWEYDVNYDNAPLQDYIEWNQIELNYSNWHEMRPSSEMGEITRGEFISALVEAELAVYSGNDSGNGSGNDGPIGYALDHDDSLPVIDERWQFRYKVPVYPQVGNAVVQALDGNGVVQLMWSVPTRNIFFLEDLPDFLQNTNDLVLEDINDIRPLAADAAFKSVGEIVDQVEGVATIDSTETGYTALRGTLKIDDMDPVFRNSLAKHLYAFAQWTPAVVAEPGPRPDDEVVLEIIENLYAMVGQRVEINAKVRDVNGNWVQTAGIPVDLYISASNDSDITAWERSYYDVFRYSTEKITLHTDTNGEVTLNISAVEVAAAIVQARAAGYVVELTNVGAPYGLNNDGGLTQINFGELEFSYIPENNEFEPVTTGIDRSKVVVGNQQNFGLISTVEWPGRTAYRDVPDLNDKNENGEREDVLGVVYIDIPQSPAVRNIPYIINLGAGSVGTFNYVKENTSTDENPNRSKGITHWSAISNKAGYQHINIVPSDNHTDWNDLGFVTKEGGPITKAGYGMPSGLNSLLITVQWMPSEAFAEIEGPSTVESIVYKMVPVTVKVTDANGNPLEKVDVKYRLNYQGGISGTSEFENGGTYEVVKTAGNGIASINVKAGEPGERIQVAVEVYNPRTGTVILIDQEGYLKEIGHKIIIWEEALPYTVTFVDWDGTVLDTQEIKHGEDAAAPADPEREGYIFTGWDVDFDNITSDLTVTAQYKIPITGVTVTRDGDTYTAAVEPDGATVNYQWQYATRPILFWGDYVNDGHNAPTYYNNTDSRIRVKVIVIGTGDYQGTVESDYIQR